MKKLEFLIITVQQASLRGTVEATSRFCIVGEETMLTLMQNDIGEDFAKISTPNNEEHFATHLFLTRKYGKPITQEEFESRIPSNAFGEMLRLAYVHALEEAGLTGK